MISEKSWIVSMFFFRLTRSILLVDSLVPSPHHTHLKMQFTKQHVERKNRGSSIAILRCCSSCMEKEEWQTFATYFGIFAGFCSWYRIEVFRRLRVEQTMLRRTKGRRWYMGPLSNHREWVLRKRGRHSKSIRKVVGAYREQVWILKDAKLTFASTTFI